MTHDNQSSVPETLRDTIISRRGNLVKDTRWQRRTFNGKLGNPDRNDDVETEPKRPRLVVGISKLRTSVGVGAGAGGGYGASVNKRLKRMLLIPVRRVALLQPRVSKASDRAIQTQGYYTRK